MSTTDIIKKLKATKVTCEVCQGKFTYNSVDYHLKSKKHLNVLGLEFAKSQKIKDYEKDYYQKNKEKINENVRAKNALVRPVVKYCSDCKIYYQNERHPTTKSHHIKAGTLDQYVQVDCPVDGCDRKCHKQNLINHIKKNHPSSSN
tara:strand:- start:69 stop:506 length:438 start_codon:yes stop_codon:yes gene_type:complete